MKNHKLKAIIFVTLATVLMISGCARNTAVNEETPTYTYWVAMPEAIVSQYSSMAEMTMYKELESIIGITIAFKHPPAGQVNEQFNLMIASRDLPDIIESSWGGYPGGPEQAISDGIIIKLNEYLEEYAPNFSKAIAGNDMYDKQSKTHNVSFFGFRAFNIGKYRTFGGLIIRQDWLDDLGLDVPETIDEWENVLMAFKEIKGARAPFTGDANIFNTGHMSHFFNSAYNVGLGFYQENGKIKYAPIEDNYIKFIDRMNKWYNLGLIDNEYPTNNGTTVDAKMTNGDSGARYGYIGGTIGRYMTAMEGRDPSYNLTAVQHPVMNKGDEPYFMERQKEATEPFLAITAVARNPEILVKWADYLYTPEGSMLKNFGVEGKTYNTAGGVPVYTDEILKNSSGISIAEAMSRHFRANSPAPGFNQDENYLNQYYPLQQQKDALNTWSKYSDNAATVLIPPITFLTEESEEISAIMSEVNTYASEMILKFVRGSESMENYKSFVDMLKSMKIDKAIELYQNALDRYNNR